MKKNVKVLKEGVIVMEDEAQETENVKIALGHIDELRKGETAPLSSTLENKANKQRNENSSGVFS